MSRVDLHLVRTVRRPPAIALLLRRLWAAWLRAFSPWRASLPPDFPGAPSPRSAPAALRKGALLSERIDARSRRSVA